MTGLIEPRGLNMKFDPYKVGFFWGVVSTSLFAVIILEVLKGLS